MTTSDGTLSELERDAVTELANIGVSRAAASLRKMVGQQVYLSVPSVDVLTRRDASILINERESSELVSVRQAFSGPFSGQAMLIFPRLNSLQLIRAVIGDDELPDSEAAEMEDEALAETGNVILNGCLGTIANMLRQSLQLSLPEVKRGSGAQIFNAADSALADGLVLFLYINFSVRDRDIRGYIALLMDLPALSAMRVLIRDFIARYVPETEAVETAGAIEELRHLAGPLFSTLEHTGIALAVMNPRLPDNPFIYVNDAFTHLTGYGQDILGRSWQTLHGPESDRRTIANIEKAMRDGKSIGVDILSHRKDSSVFRISMYFSPIPGIDGKAAFFVATLDEVSFERRAERLAQMKRDERQEVIERLRTTLSLSGGAAAWEWRIQDGRIVGDARFAAMYNITPEQAANGISANTFFSIIHPDDQTRIRLAVDGIFQGADVFTKQYRVLLPNGTVRWVHARGHCKIENERPVLFTGVFVDITDQKRIEEKLRIAQSAGGIGTFEYIDGFATVSVSTEFCALLGLQPANDLPIRTVNAVVMPGDPPLILERDVKAMAAIKLVEFRITRPNDGEVRWLARRGEFIHDADTAGLRFSGVVYDITHSKRVEERLRELNETLEFRVQERTKERDDIWMLSQDLLGIADQDGVWLSINPAWTKTLGWPASKVIGNTSDWMQSEEDTETFTDQLLKVADSPSAAMFQSSFKAAGGKFRTLAWAAVTQGGLFYCSARDITEQLELDATLVRAEEQLRQSQKMEAVGQLTGGLAHDFNNLLAGISGSLEMMEIRMNQGRVKDIERYITAAQGATKRAASLTHRLLAFSRRQTLAPKPTNVNQLISGMEEMIRRTVGPAIRIQVIGAPGLWTTLVDPPQLENALLNLCLNARDAMPEGGDITIKTANRYLDDQEARDLDLPAGEYLSLSVADTGMGMTREVIAKAFEPFFTTKPIGEGTGLGLSMIYGFARQSGGQVHIVSEVGKGTTIDIHLPRHLGEVQAETPSRVHPKQTRAERGQTILVVDDEPTVRLLVTELLEDLGYSVIEASDSSAGLKVLQSDVPIDLLITDVGLPGGMNGRQMVDAARSKRPELKVLFITGYAESTVIGKGQLPAGMHVVTKPFVIDTLGARIREITAD